MSEYSDELIFKCKTNFYQGFKSIYESVAKKTINKKYILRDFQNALEFVPLWNTNIIDTEYKRFKKNTRCGWLDDLIQASFLNMAKELLKNTENKSSIQLVIPSGPNFIHKCYINIAREIWKNPKIFYQKVSRDELKDNIEDIYDIISEQILHTLRNDLPFKDVLHSYLNKQNTVSNEVEEDEYSDSDIEDSSLSNAINETKQIDTTESNHEVGVVKHIENDEGDSVVKHGEPSTLDEDNDVALDSVSVSGEPSTLEDEKEEEDNVALDSVSVSGEPSTPEDEKEEEDDVALDSVSVSGEPSTPEDEKEEEDDVALDSVSVSGEPSTPEDDKEEEDNVILDSVSVSGEPSTPEDDKEEEDNVILDSVSVSEEDDPRVELGDSNTSADDSGEIKTVFEETTKSDISKFAEDTTEPGELNHDNVSPESTVTKAPRDDTFYEKSKVEPSDSDTESIEIDMNDIEQKLYLSDEEEDTSVAKKRTSEVKPLNLASLRNETTNDELKYVNIHGKEVYRNVEDAHTIDASESINDNVKAIRII